MMDIERLSRKAQETLPDPYILRGIHMHQPRGFMDVVSVLYRQRLRVLMAFGLSANLLLVALFACIFVLLGPDCFVVSPSSSFGFKEMFALSSHTFTTVGYGDVYPTCVAAQLVVVVEQYAQVITAALIGAIVVVKVMRPRAKIRFARVAVLGRTSTGELHLSTRFANNSFYDLRSVVTRLHVQWSHNPRNGAVPAATLALRNDIQTLMPIGYHFVPTHVVNDDSPLWLSDDPGFAPAPVAASAPNRMSGGGSKEPIDLDAILKGVVWVDLVVNAFDTRYSKNVCLMHRYWRRDIKTNARYVDMLHISGLGTPVVDVTHDHYKIDRYVHIDLRDEDAAEVV